MQKHLHLGLGELEIPAALSERTVAASHILTSLLLCFQVAEMISLLEEWPKLQPDHALELLDYAYAEPAVRSYAIECLVHIRLVLGTVCSLHGR